MRIDELTVRELQQSAIAAFPNTRRRQHATGTIKIESLRYLPFYGMKTLLVRAQADNAADDGGVYQPLMLFRNVVYQEGGITLREPTGQQFLVQPVSEGENDVLVRCQCKDFSYRFMFYDYLERSLYGVNRKPYTPKGVRPPVNPTEAAGYCKHLFKLSQILREDRLIV